MLLVAAGRHSQQRPDCTSHAGGIDIDEMGQRDRRRVRPHHRAGVWALGDINGRHQLKHMANGEAKVVQHNLMHPDDPAHATTPARHRTRCSAARRSAAVGLTEEQAVATGTAVRQSITHAYGGAAYGWAMEDTTGFCKLIGDPATRTRDRCAPDRLSGLDAGAAAGAGHAPRQHRRRDGDRPGVDPPCAVARWSSRHC